MPLSFRYKQHRLISKVLRHFLTHNASLPDGKFLLSDKCLEKIQHPDRHALNS